MNTNKNEGFFNSKKCIDYDSLKKKETYDIKK